MPFITILSEIVLDLIRSRFGQIAVAFAVPWFWSGWRTDDAWRARVAAEKAEIERQYQAEVARQAQASREIADAAIKRADEERAISSELRDKIERYANAEKSLPSMAHCVVDDDFADVVRKLTPATRPAKPPRAAGQLRKAR